MVNSIAGDFLEERYFKDGEDWESLCCRVADAHANSSTEFTEYFEMLSSCDALPNSPTLMNSGTEMGYLSACNVVPVPDDLEGIMEAVKSSAIIQKHGGGVGFTFSELRPAGDLIKKTGGTSSGVVSFLKMFDMVGQVIKQGGKRRSANLGLLHYNHPDILRWIHAKDNNGELATFNLSVALTDEFFEKLKNNEDVVFINPRDGEPFPAFDQLSESTHDSMPARELFKRITTSMWKSGEPGVIFWDTMQNNNPAKGAVAVDGVNPCVTGDTLVAVADGRNYVSIEQLAEEGKDVPVYAFDGTRMRISFGRNPRMTRRNQPIYKITFNDNSFLKMTASHRIMKRDGLYAKVSDLEVGESIMPFNRWEYTPKGKPTKYWAIGTNEKKRRWLSEHRMVAEFRGNGNLIPHHKNFDGQDNSSANLKFVSKEEHDAIHDISGDKNPMRFWWNNASKEEKQAYREKMSESTRGEKNGRYGKPVSEETRMKKSRAMKRYYVEHPEKRKEIAKGLREWFKEHGTGHLKGERSKRVIFVCPVCGTETRMTEAKSKMRKSCSLSCANRLRTMEPTVPEIYNHKVSHIEYIGNEDVYNLTVDDYHNYAVVTDPNALTRNKGFEKHSGVVIANCGESPLPHWGSCILGSINLYNHLKAQNGSMVVDFDKITYTTRVMTKFLNTVIDNNAYPLAQMKEVALKVRQIGIGIMGFADMLGVLGVRYGSENSIGVAKRIIATIKRAATVQSKYMASLHGPYPAWENAEHKTTEIRNAALTSIAPTGSISFIAGVSSGLEPFFKIAYMMNRDGKTPTFVVAHSFMSDLKKHGLEGVLEEMISKDYTPTQMIEKGLLPESFSHYITANEVTPVEHVKMQAEFQKYVDLAISKTVNLPHDATVGDIEDVIVSAHEQQCKGLTVFRDNCFRDAFLTEIACSSCGSTNIEHREGCMTCSDCGTSLCSVG